MSETGTERATVRTYVPADQKARWTADAEEMDMSLSEFVRTMVQAGRRGFADRLDVANAAADSESAAETGGCTSMEEPGSPAVDPGGRDLETVILDALREAPREYDELVEECLTDVRESVADEVGDLLQELQADNVVSHDPRAGGYTLVDDE